MVSPTTHERHAHQPDPENPWRYVCPDCKRRVHAIEGKINEPFRCKACRSTYGFSELWDKKAKQTVFDRDNWVNND